MPRRDRRRLLARIERMLAATPPCRRQEKWVILAAFVTCLETWGRRQVAAFLAWDRLRRREFFACLRRLVSHDDERRC